MAAGDQTAIKSAATAMPDPPMSRSSRLSGTSASQSPSAEMPIAADSTGRSLALYVGAAAIRLG